MTEVIGHIEGRVSLLKDDRLRALGTGLLEAIELLTTLDDLTPAGQVRMGDLRVEREQTYQLLDQLVALGYRSLATELVRLPEQVIVERLRNFGQPWATIADHMGLSTQGLHKRYSRVDDVTGVPTTSTDSSQPDGSPLRPPAEPSEPSKG